MAITTERSWSAAAWLAVALAMGVHGACNGHVTVETGGTGGTGGGGSGPTGGGTGGTSGKTSSVTTSVGPTTSVTTSSITTSVGPTTTTGGGPVNVAAECASDFDCGGNGHCVTPQDNDPIFGGGAPGGYCTHKCSTDAECEGPASTCLMSPDGVGECALGCTFGVPELMYLNDPLDREKCHGREDLRCQQIPDGSQVCLPTCGSDAQCPGRHCDAKTSVCVDAAPAGDPLGAKCDPMAMATTCAGICIAVAGGQSLCTSACTMGGEIPNENECGGSGSGVCLFSPQGTGVGDLGFCAQACGAQDHCQTPDFFCFDIGLPDLGTCLNSESCTKDSDCQGLPNGSCVATKLGSFCMSSKYPLDSLAP